MNMRRTSHPTEPTRVPSTGAASPASDAARLAEDWTKTLGLIESVAEAKDRDESVVSMVKEIARHFPSCTVRCGIGAVRLRKFFDSKLGWLGPSSELFQDASLGWEDDAQVPTRPAIPSDELARASTTSVHQIRLNVDDDKGTGRCVLWIQGPELTNSDRNWLRRALPMLRAMIWHRGGGVVASASRAVNNTGMTARVYLGLATMFVILLAVWPVSYRVRCSTLVRPKHSRVIAAPFDATLLETHVQPGDRVTQGEVLFSLDGRPLRLELESVEAQIAQVIKEHVIAMVGDRIAESQQAKLKIRELTRQRDLLASRLDRLRVVSPIEGVVVLGDLNRSIGAPLSTGQSVMEIAPLNEMVIELEIPEYEIGYVEKGTPTRIRLTAADGNTIEQPIGSVYPSAELRDDQSVFVAQIEVANEDGTLRPGMRGEAIAYGPIRPWLWSLTRTGFEKVLWWIGY